MRKDAALRHENRSRRAAPRSPRPCRAAGQGAGHSVAIPAMT